MTRRHTDEGGWQVAGDATDVLARCRVLHGLGARHLSFGPPLGPDPLTAIRLLSNQVLPALDELTEEIS